MGNLNEESAGEDRFPMDEASPVHELEGIAAEIRSLNDLFRRRLLEDKAKNTMFERLYEQLEFSRDGLRRQVMQPILEEIVLVVDRIEAQGGSDEFVSSIRAELVEVLARRFVTPIPAEEHFDPTRHEAVDVDTEAYVPEGTITAIRRHGWLFGDVVLRPSQVVVSRGPR